MTIQDVIKQTRSFQLCSQSLQSTILSPSVIGIFKNAYEMKKAGFSYKEWSDSTCAGFSTKLIVKEIYRN
jgi:hypothetical protein